MKSKKIEIKWAVVFTIITLIWMYFEKSMGWHDDFISKQGSRALWFAVIALALYFLAIADKKKIDFHGKMRWVDGFKSGILISLFVAILTPITQYITHEWISPNYFDHAIKHAVESDMMTQEQAEDNFRFGSYIFQAIINVLVMGVIFSAITAFVFRSKKTKAKA